ncbi:thioesterase family protein [Mycobacterium sp. MMS18-G62]
MPAPFFVSDGDIFAPTSIARGPWGPSLAGNYIGGLLAHAVDRAAPTIELRPARLTVDLLRPVSLHPVTVETSLIRDGRRLRLIDATMTQRGILVARGSVLFLGPSEHEANAVWTSPISMPTPPAGPDSVALEVPMLIHSYGRDPVHGSAGVGLDEWRHDGPKYAWVKETHPLVDDEPLGPFVRAAMAADITSSLANWGTAGLQFINADYTMTLSRLPRGDYIGLAALTHYHHAGIGTGSATLFDSDGPIGSGMVTALYHPGFTAPTAPLRCATPAPSTGPATSLSLEPSIDRT